jgi:UDP-glucose 4-epimerase
MIEQKRVFITGGAGFIGSALTGRLIEKNKITIYDDFRRDALKDKPYLNHPNLTIVDGDVMDLQLLKESIKTSQIVVHCAGITGIDTVIEKPSDTIRVNLIGTANVLEASSELDDLYRFIGFSTSEVFGQSCFRAEEDHSTQIGAVGEARWTYAVSKLAAEHLTKAYNKEFGVPTATLRPFNIYGPGQVGEGAMKTFVQRALSNEEIQVHGDGNQIRAWCYIDDFIDGLLCAIEHPNAIGESFNIGNARAVLTISNLAETVIRVLGSSSSIKFTRKDYADVELRVPSVEKARKLLGFEAKVNLEEGVRKTAEFYKRLMS